MQNIADDVETAATCIMCGKLLAGLEVVKYRDWWAHAECAQAALEKQVDQFNRIPFFLGSLGLVFGFILNFFIIMQYPSMNQNPLYYAIPFLGMAIGLLFQTFGFYGFTTNYDEGLGIVCGILSIAASLFHFLVAGLTLLNGYDSSHYDSETGDFLFFSIPGVYLSVIASYFLLLIMMALIGVMILMLGRSVTGDFDNRIVAIIFIAAAAFMVLSPANFFIEAFLITVLFLTAKVPEEWKKIEL